MPVPEGTKKVDLLFGRLPPELRPVSDALRRTIREVAPQLREEVKWRSPVWMDPASGRIVVNLQVYDDHVNLGFWRGAELASAHATIEGTGKGLRHIKIPDPKAASTPAVKRAIRAAVRLDAAGPPR